MILLTGIGLLVASLTIVVGSLIAAALVLDEVGGLAGAGEWSTVWVMFGKAMSTGWSHTPSWHCSSRC